MTTTNKPKKILVIEDSADSRELICHLLQSAGLQVDSADNGKEGLEKALKQKPDLLLLDLEMPVLNGFGVIKQLRASDYNKPIVAITAHNTIQDRDRCQDAGFDGMISKPFDQEGLVRVLKEHLSTI
jgi:CheY-like chemotaxis protein